MNSDLKKICLKAGFFDPGEREKFFACAKKVVVKVGSGVLTAKTGLNLTVMHELAGQIAWLMESGRQVILVTSGAVASGVRRMGMKERPRDIPEKQAAAAVGQAGLIMEYEEAFEKKGVKVAQILLTRDDLAARRRYLNARNTLQTLLSWKVLPIINENDTVVVEELKFGDNDNLSAMIAQLLDADVLINLTDIDGLYTADPATCPNASLVRYVDKIDSAVIQAASAIAGSCGIGGMSSKVAAAKKACAAGIPMVVANGAKPGVLEDVFSGRETGTFFAPQKKRMARKKCWIGYAAKPGGAFVVDKGAAQALVRHGKSLLPVGICEVCGNFGVGAAVEIRGPDNKVLGVGLTNYTAIDAKRIMGRPSREIEKILEHKGYDEVIHRDNLVILLENEEEFPWT